MKFAEICRYRPIGDYFKLISFADMPIPLWESVPKIDLFVIPPK